MSARFFADFLTDESAVTSIEYALIAGLLSILIVAGATMIGSKLSANYYGPVANNLP